jgi:hypothetical protein
VKQDNKDHQPIKRQVAGTAGLRRAVSGRSTAAGSHSTIRPIAAISIATHPAWSAAFRRSSAILSSPWSGGRLRVSATGVRHLPSPHRALTNAEGRARSSTTAQSAPPSTQRSISHLQEEVTARRRARLCYSTRGTVDVGDGISDRSSSHEVHAISAEQGGEHVDNIIVVLDGEQRPTGKFRKLGSFHGPAGDHYPDRRSRPLRSAIDMRWPFSTAPFRASGRPSSASRSRSASTVLSMNVSTSRPIEWASSSATTNARGLTHKGHRREFAYPIP